jgi:hypothetical protein
MEIAMLYSNKVLGRLEALGIHSQKPTGWVVGLQAYPMIGG